VRCGSIVVVGRRIVLVLLVAAAWACGHREPRCAVQDCKTHQIIDDGCVTDWKGGKTCASCVNACPDDVPPGAHS
jgi:hypothetical protein